MVTVITHLEWMHEGRRRFGDDVTRWRFVCPACGHVAMAQDWIDEDAQRSIAFSCIGRWRGSCREAFGGEGEGPCNYAGGGLFGINPVRVVGVPDNEAIDVFAFADESAEAE